MYVMYVSHCIVQSCDWLNLNWTTKRLAKLNVAAECIEWMCSTYSMSQEISSAVCHAQKTGRKESGNYTYVQQEEKLLPQ